MINVPVAADNTFFEPHLCRAGFFTVGGKHDERKFADFRQALVYLRTQPAARWRRPNDKGNWGILTAVAWADRHVQTSAFA